MKEYLLQAGIHESIVDHCDWRSKYDFFEMKHLYLEKDEIALFWGGRRNLISAFELAQMYQFADIIVIETSKDINRKMTTLSNEIGLDNITFIENIDIAFNNNAKMDIGLLVIDENIDLNMEILEKLTKQFKIRQIVGEYNASLISEKDIFTTLKKNVEFYLFREFQSQEIITGHWLKEQDCEECIDLSVVVPIYNVEKYLKQCVDSLLKPCELNVEILLINDGSTDQSELIATEYEEKHLNVKLINKPNGGCASARSKGLNCARGEYVCFIDSDDWIEQGMFDELYNSAKLHNSDIAFSGFRKVFEDDGCIEDVAENVWCTNGVCDGLVSSKNDMFWCQPAIWRGIYNRKFLLNNKIDFPHQLKRFDDLFFNFITISLADRVSYVPTVYYNYRLGRVGQDVAANDERLYVHFEIFDLIRERISQIGDINMEWNLLLVELCTHKWGLKKTLPKLKWSYLRKASNNFNRKEFLPLRKIPLHTFRYIGSSFTYFAILLMTIGIFTRENY